METNKAKELLQSANSIIVLLPPQPDADSLVAGLSLHQSLKNAGKTSVIGCSNLGTNQPQIDGQKEIKTNIGNQKLVVSFDYKEENVENVSYDIDENAKKFNLIIQPKAGQNPIDPSTVTFTYSGASADLVVTLGVNSLEELGKIYSDEKQFLDQAKIVNINASGRPSTFAEVNLAMTGKSITEITGQLLKATNFTPTDVAATNLYRQLLISTTNFQAPGVDAETFDLAAFLLRNNAQKAAVQPRIQTPAPQIIRPQHIATQAPTQAPRVPTNVPSDWQKPKIFKSSEGAK